MKTSFAALLFCLTLLASAALGQATSVTKNDISQAEIDTIIQKLTQGERLFREALNVYNFNRNATVQTIGMGGQISGVYRRDSALAFGPSGERTEKVLFAPVSTLTEITVTAADIENLGGIDPYAIEPKAIGRYNFTYLGKERIDELDLHVFDVSPKVIPDWKKSKERLFSGRIWVDDQDLLIVKTKGKAVPEGKERFPIMETWREQIDGKYWFPSQTRADDDLVFENGQVVKLRVRVKYSNYSRGRTDIKIIGEEEDVPTPAATPVPAKKP